MSDSSLNIQRYNSGLMTPKEAAAFERAVEKSPELQAEFDKVGDTLLSMYKRISEGMPAPDSEIKDILLSKITEDSGKRGAALLATGGAIALTPDVLSDSSLPTEGTKVRSLASSKTVVGLFLAALIGISSVIAISTSHEPVQTLAMTDASKIIENPIAGNSTPAAATHERVIHNGKNRIIFQKNGAPPLLPENNTQTDITEKSENIIPSVKKEHQDQEVGVPAQKGSSATDVGGGIPHGANEPTRSEYVSESSWGDKFSVSIRHFSSLKFYPGRLDMAPRPSVNNWGAALNYHLSNTVAIGIEAGRETYPFYKERANEMYDEYYSITWGGVSLTLSDLNFEILGCRPEARILTGYSTAGPMGKLSAGFIWEPVHNISLSPELEYTGTYVKNTGVFIEGNDDVTFGAKLGFTVSAMVRF